MNALHPKNWSLACWAIFLIWIALAIAGNTIFSSTIPTDDTLQSVAAYGGLGVGREIGWPFAYG